MQDTNDAKQKQTWKRFFIITGSSAGGLILLSVVGTIALQLSLPHDCASCGMAAIGLAPLYLLALAALITLWIGLGVWATKRTQSARKRMLIILAIVSPLLAYAIRLIVTF